MKQWASKRSTKTKAVESKWMPTPAKLPCLPQHRAEPERTARALR